MRDRMHGLLLIDSDLVFRLGLRVWLDRFPDLAIVAEADTAESALSILAGGDRTQISNAAEPYKPPGIDLIVLGLNLGCTNLDRRISGLELCQQLKSQYPTLPILLLSSPQDPDLVAAALRTGVEGYCLKGKPDEELVAAIRQVAAGNPYLSDRYAATTEPVVTAIPERKTSVLAILRQNIQASGLRQIDAALSELKVQLNSQRNTTTDRIAKAFLAGRARELHAARWFVQRVGGRGGNSRQSPASTASSPPYSPGSTANSNAPQTDPSGQPLVTSGDRQLANAMAIQFSLWDTTVAKLQSNLSNLTRTPLEIDILRDEKKRELLYIILRQLENTLLELRSAATQPQQLLEQQPAILKDLWQTATTNFFGKYYMLTVRGKANVNVVEVLLQDTEVVETSILNKIPQVTEFLSHLLFQTQLVIDNTAYAAGTLEAMRRAEVLLDNLLIQIANGVIQPLLNHFADVEEVKQKFYAYGLIATREIERFRNDLSWKYRLAKYIAEPQAIFESRNILFAFASPGIKKVDIYAPRSQELQQLEGVQLFVTLALELQDAIAPRLRSATAFIGSGIVYVLTNIVGRGIGLIGRGVLQGIGSAWQDSRVRKTGDRMK